MEILLLASLTIPLFGAFLCWGSRLAARSIALLSSVIVLGIVAILVWGFPDPQVLSSRPGADQYAVLDDLGWLGWTSDRVDIRFSLGLDGLSLWLFALTALLVVVSVLVSWKEITYGAPTFYGLLLLLETGMLGVFAARDIILFYVFFELTLIPLFFLIGIWGSEARRYAAIKFFLFTLVGSVLTFLSLLAITIWHFIQTGKWTFSIPELTASLAAQPMEPLTQLVIFLGLFAGFAIKVPLVPLHTWLPLAHVEAPTAGSVLLAGILLKVGSYGFVRFCLPMVPRATVEAMPWLLALSVAGIIYGSLVALAQRDIKRLIAYSSVGHLGFCMLGVFALNRLGWEGGVLQMVNHGLSTGALFALVGMLYARYHTRQIDDYRGLARRMPWWAFFMVLMVLSSIGLPGLNGFAGEFLVLQGIFQRAWGEWQCPLEWVGLLRCLAIVSVAGVVLGAWYMLWMVERVVFGPLDEPASHQPHGSGVQGGAANMGHQRVASAEGGHAAGEGLPHDLEWREILALAPIGVLVVVIGVYPKYFLDRMSPTLQKLAQPAVRALAARLPTPGEDSPVVVAAVPRAEQRKQPEVLVSASACGRWGGGEAVPEETGENRGRGAKEEQASGFFPCLLNQPAASSTPTGSCIKRVLAKREGTACR